jgi:hypothetical protein
MKIIVVVGALSFAVACGGGSSAPPDRLANFLGTPWNTSVTTTVNCAFLSRSENRTYSIPFARGTDADLQYTSAEGCTYKFNVSGNTATLANPGVSCTFSIQGVAVTANWASYTATTSDGRTLTISTAGNGSALGQTCPFTEAGSATR